MSPCRVSMFIVQVLFRQLCYSCILAVASLWCWMSFWSLRVLIFIPLALFLSSMFFYFRNFHKSKVLAILHVRPMLFLICPRSYLSLATIPGNRQSRWPYPRLIGGEAMTQQDVCVVQGMDCGGCWSLLWACCTELPQCLHTDTVVLNNGRNKFPPVKILNLRNVLTLVSFYIK